MGRVEIDAFPGATLEACGTEYRAEPDRRHAGLEPALVGIDRIDTQPDQPAVALRELPFDLRHVAEARPQSGYFVRRRARALEEPAITLPPQAPRYVGISGMVARVRAAALDPKIVPLGTASPAAELFPAQRFQRLASRVARRQPIVLTTYGFSSGNAAFCHQLARRYLEWGVTIGADEFVVTHGCTEAVGLALRAVASGGDTIAVESPAYYGTLQTIESQRLKVVEVPTHPREGISLEALDVVLRHHDIKVVVVSANASNPLGATMSDARKKALVEMVEARDVSLIEDDIYGDLHFGASRPLGGFVVWVELPFDIDTMALYDDAVAQGFSFAPGRLFSSTDRYRHCLRLSCGHPWSPEREHAVVKLGRLIKNPGAAV